MAKSVRDVQTERDTLENELVALKLDRKQLTERNSTTSREMEQIKSRMSKLTEERDLMAKKLEEEEKNKDDEVKKLSEEVGILTNENKVMRQRNEKLQQDVSRLSSVRSELEAQIKQPKQKSLRGKENGGFRPDLSRKGSEVRIVLVNDG